MYLRPFLFKECEWSLTARSFFVYNHIKLLLICSEVLHVKWSDKKLINVTVQETETMNGDKIVIIIGVEIVIGMRDTMVVE